VNVNRLDGQTPRHTPNYGRRLIGVLICLAPGILLLASLGLGLLKQGSRTTGLGWMCVALMFGLCNSYLPFIRPRLFRWRNGSLEQYRHASAIPVFGTILVLVGGLLGFGAVVTACAGLAAILLDTGGSFWFLLATWNDLSLWDD
jgi:hypothetical protein